MNTPSKADYDAAMTALSLRMDRHCLQRTAELFAAHRQLSLAAWVAKNGHPHELHHLRGADRAQPVRQDEG